MINGPKLGIGAIIQNKEGKFSVVKENVNKDFISKRKGDISFPFGTVGDNIKNEFVEEALLREISEETGISIEGNNFKLLGELLLLNINSEILFRVFIFHIKLNGILDYSKDRIIDDEIKSSKFITKEELENLIKNGKTRVGVEEVFNEFILWKKHFNIEVTVGPGSDFDKERELKNEE